MPQCTAKSKRTGQRCTRPAMIGRTVCYHHGGKTLTGTAAPGFKTGRYSKYLPTRLIERYEEAASDPDLLGLREDIALLDSRLSDLLKRVDTGESGALWNKARSALTAFNAARTAGDATAMQEALTDLQRAISRGVSDYAAWHEIGDVIEQRRKLVESERKRLIELQQILTIEKAMLLVGALSEIVRRHVADRGQLAAISQDIHALLNRPAPDEG